MDWSGVAQYVEPVFLVALGAALTLATNALSNRRADKLRQQSDDRASAARRFALGHKRAAAARETVFGMRRELLIQEIPSDGDGFEYGDDRVLDVIRNTDLVPDGRIRAVATAVAHSLTRPEIFKSDLEFSSYRLPNSPSGETPVSFAQLAGLEVLDEMLSAYLREEPTEAQENGLSRLLVSVSGRYLFGALSLFENDSKP
jgi:hypothetical protein